MGIVNAINQRDSTRCGLLQQIREPFFYCTGTFKINLQNIFMLLKSDSWNGIALKHIPDARNLNQGYRLYP